MANKLLLFLFLSMIACGLNAQKNNNGISFTGEASIPGFQDEQGFGVSVKGLYGIGKSGQLTATLGIARFTINAAGPGQTTTRLIPFLAGYRQNIRRFFVEPQVGVGELGGRVKLDGGDYASPSVLAVFGGFNAGYHFRQLSTGLRFQATHGIEGAAAGLWNDRSFHYTGVFISYDIVSRRFR